MKMLNGSALKIGDVILTTANRPISKGIRAASKSDISHAMICVQTHSVIDATSDGVQSHNTGRLFFEDACAVHVLRLIDPLPDAKMRLVIDYVRSCVGTEYSTKEAIQTVLGGKIQSTKKQFCSRLVARAYAYGGISIVDNKDYCTPEHIKKSALFRSVENSVLPVSQADMDAMQRIPSTPEKMIEATNNVLAGARKISKSIQSLNDLDSFLIEHPEHDEYFASLYKESGYLTVWAFEKKKNEWQYDLHEMKAMPAHDLDKRSYCEDLLNDPEGIRRFAVNLAGYTAYLSAYKLETFRLAHDLYAKLFSLHVQRVQVARDWLTLHATKPSRKATQPNKSERLEISPISELIVTSTSEWFALPELKLPSIKSQREKGSIYRLHNVGIFFIPNEQIEEAPEKAYTFGHKKILPTAVIDFKENIALYRLPLDLSQWVSTCVSMAQSGHNVFPCEVEFGRLNGRAYADLL